MNERRQRRGFTQLEFLVAAGITLLLAGIMLAVTAGALAAWRRAQGVQDTAAQAALALDFLARDLQSALVTSDGNTWLASDVLNTTTTAAAHGWFTSGMIKPSGAESQQLVPPGPTPRIEDARFGLTGCWLRFFTAKADGNATGRDLSAPTAVGYQVLRRRVGTTGAVGRYRLYRAEVRQTASAAGRPGTFQSGYDITAGNYTIASATQGDAGTILTPVAADVLADNVVDFGLWFYVRTASGGLQRISPATSTDFGFRAPSASGAAPVAVDVTMRVLTQEGAGQISALEGGQLSRPAVYATDAEWWWAVAVANSKVYVRRIALQGGLP